MLQRLLEQFAPDSYAVITDRVSAFAGSSRDGWLPVPHFFRGTPGPFQPSVNSVNTNPDSTPSRGGTGRDLLGGTLSRLFETNSIAHLRALTAQTVAVIEREQPEIILAPSSDPVFIVAAARAARITNRQLYLHLFDLFAGNRYSAPKRILASRNEGAILRQARYVFVPNEAMALYYRNLLGIVPVVIPNGTGVPSRSAARSVSTVPTILYTGAVYWAQLDSVRNLVTALRQLPGVKFDVKTSASKYHLMRAGLGNEQLAPGFASQDSSMRAQHNADLLFLPLAFKTSAPAVIKTALPAKTAEYMVSGTPILVHAPPDAYISQYAREEGWGYVVDNPDPNQLAAGVRRLLDDGHLRTELVARAYEVGARNHDLRDIVPKYARYFS